MTDQRFVVHLPVVAGDVGTALLFARTVVRSLAVLGELGPGEILAGAARLSEVDGSGLVHRLFCERLDDQGRPCVLRADHPGRCVGRGER